MLKKNLLVIALVAFASACTDIAPVDIGNDEPATKAEAIKLKKKKGWKLDWCELLGWYGDGICDGFCDSPDPDCAPTEKVCGGFAGQTCGTGEYCRFELDAICGYADATGVCEPRPEACTKQYTPVCGCDGQTYGNSCEANSAGTGVYAEGACAVPEGSFCGGFAGIQCGSGQYCDFESAACGEADQGGTCRNAPEACIQLYAPVCGCNGQTYGNACNAASAGTDVLHDGEC